jgi:glycine/D-amino acid oxidase-like deaminating enzyme
MAETFDAIVIGGGVVGTSVLFQLSRMGCRALLVERDDIAGGTTAYSSGIVRTHYSVASNVEIARASLSMFENFRALLDDDPEADAGLVKSGYLIVAPPGASSDAVRASIAMQRRLGIEAALLDRAEALEKHSWLHLDDIDAIGFEADAGFADPYLVATGFARAAKRLGATIRVRTDVTGLIRSGERVIGVQTRGGDISAPVVLSAVNVWSRTAAGWAGFDIPMTISAHQIFTLKAAETYGSDLPIVKDLASSSKLYMRPTSGTLMVGNGLSGETTTDPDMGQVAGDADMLLDEAVEAAHRLPAFAEGQLMRSWSGLYDATPDWNPVLGAIPGIEGLSVAFGFSGHGFKLSPMIGRMLAQSMLGETPDLPIEPYRITRFAEGALLMGAYGIGAVS